MKNRKEGRRNLARTVIEFDHSITNEEFLAKYARPGCVVMIGGNRLLEQMLRRAQTNLSDWSKSLWSHIAIYGGERPDGKKWIFTSDLDIRAEGLINGYIESTTDYYVDHYYPNMAILDFGLTPEQTGRLIDETLRDSYRRMTYPVWSVLLSFFAVKILDFINGRMGARFFTTRAAITRIFRHTSKPKALMCSAFVRQAFLDIGVDIAPSIGTPVTFPEDIFRTPVSHTRYLLLRQQRRSKKDRRSAA